jgi:voltage-gated potassium channel
VTGQSQLRRLIVTVLLIAAATAVYFEIPVPGRMREGSWVVMFSVGVIVLGLLIMLSVRGLLRAGEQAKIRGLVLLLTATVLFFSWADESVAALPNQFAELTNKTDALYFNISTLATVGFGDVHPAGQLARGAVTLQIVFNLVFLGTAVSMISGFFRRKAQSRTTTSTGSSPDGGDSNVGDSNGGGQARPADPQPGS